MVVGTKTTDCKFDFAARKIALKITSVLPNATSPTINLSDGIILEKSLITSWIAFNWSSVSTYGKVLTNLSYSGIFVLIS